MILDFERKYLKILECKYKELNELLSLLCVESDEQLDNLLHFKSALVGYMYLYVKWIIGMRHDEPKDMLRELLRCNVINKNESEHLIQLFDSFENGDGPAKSDIKNIVAGANDVLFSVIKKLEPSERCF